MTKPEWIAHQSSHPRGLLGHLVARIMALDTAAANRMVIDTLAPGPGDQILEVGCGHGRSLRLIAARVSHGRVVGIDPSDVMCAVASRHNRRLIRAERVMVERGEAQSVPAPDDSFDKAFSVHTLYFWPDLDAGLRELRRVLRTGGQLLLAFHSSENRAVADSLPESVYMLRSGDEVAQTLARSGFHDIQIQIDPASQLRQAIASA